LREQFKRDLQILVRLEAASVPNSEKTGIAKLREQSSRDLQILVKLEAVSMPDPENSGIVGQQRPLNPHQVGGCQYA